MASINEIARIAGISVATVSRAFRLDSSISQETRQKILEIAESLNYHPKEYKQKKCIKSKHAMIGVIIGCHNYPWSNRIIGGINSIMSTAGITPIIADTNENPQRDILCIDRLKDVVSGMLIVSSSEMDEYGMNFIMDINKKIPVVSLIRNINISGIDSIKVDGFRSTYDVINKLIENGHEHIGIINGPMIFKQSFDRLAAYSEALKGHNIPIRNDYICYGSFNEEHCRELTVGLLKLNPKITAIFSANTSSSRGCMQAFAELNIHIPDDLAFVSYGDDYFFGLENVNISVISDPDFDIGCQAAQLLLHRIQNSMKNNNPHRLIIKPEIILRGSEVFPKNRLGERKVESLSDPNKN